MEPERQTNAVWVASQSVAARDATAALFKQLTHQRPDRDVSRDEVPAKDSVQARMLSWLHCSGETLLSCDAPSREAAEDNVLCFLLEAFHSASDPLQCLAALDHWELSAWESQGMSPLSLQLQRRISGALLDASRDAAAELRDAMFVEGEARRQLLLVYDTLTIAQTRVKTQLQEQNNRAADVSIHASADSSACSEALCWLRRGANCQSTSSDNARWRTVSFSLFRLMHTTTVCPSARAMQHSECESPVSIEESSCDFENKDLTLQFQFRVHPILGCFRAHSDLTRYFTAAQGSKLHADLSFADADFWSEKWLVPHASACPLLRLLLSSLLLDDFSSQDVRRSLARMGFEGGDGLRKVDCF